MHEISAARTDLAAEARQLWRERARETDTLPGVEAEDIEPRNTRNTRKQLRVLRASV